MSDQGTGSPLDAWGSIDCQRRRQADVVRSGGDPFPAAFPDGASNNSFRRVRVFDGDKFFGERCELGSNDRATGPTVLYAEGQRRLTFISLRLPRAFPLNVRHWQVVAQMKQTQPSADSGTPVLALEAWDGRWILRQSNSSGPDHDAHQIWSAPARRAVWTRFAFDITYSADRDEGRIGVFADLNGDGDFMDRHERGGMIRTYTLKHEPRSSNPPRGSLPAGSSIPSHLRAGLYHDPVIRCPRPRGCWLDIDTTQVIAPDVLHLLLPGSARP